MVYMYHGFLIHSSADGHLGCEARFLVVALSFLIRKISGPKKLEWDPEQQ